MLLAQHGLLRLDELIECPDTTTQIEQALAYATIGKLIAPPFELLVLLARIIDHDNRQR
jgi:hypothetical protein